jgi:hypothetical protein
VSRTQGTWVGIAGAAVAASVLAVGALIGFVNLGSEPQTGTVIARELVGGHVVARIEAPAPYLGSSGEVIVADLVLPIEYDTAATIPVRVRSDGSVELAETRFRMPGLGILSAFAAIGALAGLVIAFSARGYGFVRGTGRPGTMRPSDVDEDRGFYWRS